jgi:hypothetical protein
MINRITNYELRITNKRIFFFFVVFVICHLSFVASAKAWLPGEPLVPCGGTTGLASCVDFGGGSFQCLGGSNGGNFCQNNSDCPGGSQQPACTKCELLHLVKNIIDFIMIALAPILATVFFIIAGVYLMLGGANPGMLATGKRMFSSTFMGILIVMLAWLITNTLIRTIAATIIVDESTGEIIDTSQWWNISCERIGL